MARRYLLYASCLKLTRSDPGTLLLLLLMLLLLARTCDVATGGGDGEIGSEMMWSLHSLLLLLRGWD